MRLRVLTSEEIALELKKGEVVCSISEISRLLKVDRATVSKSIRNHEIKPAGIRRGNPIYPLHEVARKVLFSYF